MVQPLITIKKLYYQKSLRVIDFNAIRLINFECSQKYMQYVDGLFKVQWFRFLCQIGFIIAEDSTYDTQSYTYKTVLLNSVVASAAYAENITSQKPFSTSDSIPAYLSRIEKMKIFTLFTQNSLISFTQQYLELFTFPNRFNKQMYRMEDAALAFYQLWNANIRHVPKQLIPI